MDSSPPKIRVCVVDSEQLFGELFITVLRAEDDLDLCSVCKSVEDALNQFLAMEFDVLLLVTRGTAREHVEDLARLGVLPRKPKVAVVAAAVSNADAVLFRSVGVSGILLTSCTTELLLKFIRRISAGELWFSQAILQALLEPRKASTVESDTSQPHLTDRETRVLRHVIDGLTNKEIATEIGATETAVKATLQALFGKFHVHTRSSLVRVAMESHPPSVLR